MKKSLIVGLLLGLSTIASADSSGVYMNFGPLNLTVPWSNVNATYLYDFVGKQNLLGGETEIASLVLKKDSNGNPLLSLDGMVGAVTSTQGLGTPYAGVTIDLKNPVSALDLGAIKPGLFAGYNFRDKTALFGIKAALNLFGA